MLFSKNFILEIVYYNVIESPGLLGYWVIGLLGYWVILENIYYLDQNLYIFTRNGTSS